MNNDLPKFDDVPVEVVVLSISDYQGLDSGFLSKLHRDGWSITEIDYVNKHVVFVR